LNETLPESAKSCEGNKGGVRFPRVSEVGEVLWFLLVKTIVFFACIPTNGFEVNDSSVALYSPITVHPMELVLMYWMRGARGPDPTRLSPHHGDGEFEAAR